MSEQLEDVSLPSDASIEALKDQLRDVCDRIRERRSDTDGDCDDMRFEGKG